MPELPEVQTVINSLKAKISNKYISNYKELWNKVNYSQNSNMLRREIYNRRIINLDRIGKYIIIKLDYNYLIFHLRMTGYLYFSLTLPVVNKYIRCYFIMKDGSYLIFEDIRKFGGFYYIKNTSIIKSKLGMDALNKRLNNHWMYKILKKMHRKIKYVLLDQSIICGLGNIYVDEILWLSKLHPLKLSNKITNQEIKVLSKSIKSILTDSIKYHGTTIKNFKFDNMKSGNYKNKLNVYGRKNKKCNRCNNDIIKIKACGRTTYFCPECQKI